MQTLRALFFDVTGKTGRVRRRRDCSEGIRTRSCEIAVLERLAIVCVMRMYIYINEAGQLWTRTFNTRIPSGTRLPRDLSRDNIKTVIRLLKVHILADSKFRVRL